MPPSALYLPNYSQSHALVIGINKYQHAGPLMHACNDAKAVAETLIGSFGFPKQNVGLLLDQDATRDAIMRAFHKFETCNPTPLTAY
jgi:uncharacterized caspase-like protein